MIKVAAGLIQNQKVSFYYISAVYAGLKHAGLGGLEFLEEDEEKKPFACDYSGCNKRYVKQSHLEVDIWKRFSANLNLCTEYRSF